MYIDKYYINYIFFHKFDINKKNQVSDVSTFYF